MGKLQKLLVALSSVAVFLLLFGPHILARTGLGPIPPLAAVTVPEYEPVEVQWPAQGWTPDDTQWFYHATQGGGMEIPIPYDWFVHLERGRLPALWWADAGRLVDEEHMARFGFLPNPRTSYEVSGLSDGWAAPEGSTLVEDQDNNPDSLPVGFVKTLHYPDYHYKGGGEEEQTRIVPNVVGFNCSLCHTGQLNYRGKGFRVEGGPAMIELGQFQREVSNALLLTMLIPSRFNRLADRVLEGLPDQEKGTRKASMKVELRDLLERGGALAKELEERSIYPTWEGFARLDAVGRIGNYVMGEEIGFQNLSVADAPVNFPHIWDTPWFEWVQYNASFKLPMMRNAGEAMGVFAAVNFKDVDDPELLYTSSINMANLYEMEALIRGREPYTGLQAPRWPDIFPPIDTARARVGERLYAENCQGCHLPSFNRPDSFLADTFWVEDQGRRYLRLNVVNLYDVGTDPQAALNMVARTAEIGRLGLLAKDPEEVHGLKGMDATGMGGEVTFGVGLPFLITQAMEKKFEDLGYSEEMKQEYRGHRSPPFIRAPLGYKARPLNGVWATPPFLHNGSVPSIYKLLSPVEERDSIFWLGSKEYDPVHLGYDSRELKGGFKFDTGLLGNSNKGHHFTGDKDSWKSGRKGVIGRYLEPDERLAIIEFLKSMPSVPGGPWLSEAGPPPAN